MDTRVYDLAASQHGLITREQALSEGLSAGAWQWLTRGEDWRRVYAGVYARTGSPRTWEQELMAGCLSAHGIASHRAAAALWRLPDVPPRLEVTIPKHRRADLDGFAVHRCGLLLPVDRGHRSGIPVTALPKTVLDVSLEVPRLAPALVDHVLARRRVPLELLINRLKDMGTGGRAGARNLLTLLEERRGRKRHVDSGLQRALEKIAIAGYKAGVLPKPSFECPVQLSDGRWKYPDLGYPQVDVGFEAVSFLHHSTIEEFAHDIERNLDLFGHGWVIVPLTAVQIRAPVRLTALMARIIAAVAARRGAAAGIPRL